ncbi:MAG: polymer-forming cytoskeletal protein [Pseudomonadota bacterium]
MFNKKSDHIEPETRPQTPQTERAEPGYMSSIEVRTRNVSVIGPTLRFKGELSANEDLVIEGEVEGKIAHQDKNLTVGKQGRVTADIRARNVEIHGEVTGDIFGDDRVVLSKTAVVNGNIDCGRVVLEDGALFTGSIRMERKAAADSKPKLKVADSGEPTGDENPGVEQGAA